MLVRLDLDLRKNYPVKMSEKMKNCPFLYQIFFSSLFTLMGKFLEFLDFHLKGTFITNKALLFYESALLSALLNAF